MRPAANGVDDRRVTEGLLHRWGQLVGTLRPARELGENLLERWSEPHRRYHTVAHLRACLDAVDLLAREASDVTAVRLAVWFHDAVYEREPGSDEEASARLAERDLHAIGLDAARVVEVARLVRLTLTHDPAPGDRNGAVLCDADLSVLGGDPTAYAAYASLVRDEYAFLDENTFRIGRRRVLESLLAHDPLFRTTTAQTLWETRARHNTTMELTLLRAMF